LEEEMTLADITIDDFIERVAAAVVKKINLSQAPSPADLVDSLTPKELDAYWKSRREEQKKRRKQ
jgi:hypothetical protein